MLTFNVAIWIFGFLFSNLRFNAFIASFGCTLFERIISEISKFKAISSLYTRNVSNLAGPDGTEVLTKTKQLLSQPARPWARKRKTSPP